MARLIKVFSRLTCNVPRQIPLLAVHSSYSVLSRGRSYNMPKFRIKGSYSGHSGIMGSDGKQNTALAGARGHENCCTFCWFS